MKKDIYTETAETVASSKQTITSTYITKKQIKKALKGFKKIFRDVIKQARNNKKVAPNNTSKKARIIPGKNENIKNCVFWVVSEKKKAPTIVFQDVNTYIYTFKASQGVFQALPVAMILFKMVFSGVCNKVILFNTS